MNKSNVSRGIGFSGLLAIVFIVLKLTNVIAWSWLWVLAPIWGSVALEVIFAVAFLLWALLRKDD